MQRAGPDPLLPVVRRFRKVVFEPGSLTVAYMRGQRKPFAGYVVLRPASSRALLLVFSVMLPVGFIAVLLGAKRSSGSWMDVGSA